MSPLRVAFVDQQGDETGGAEESLALLLAHLPPSIEPHVVLFNGGRFADRLRAKGLDVHVLPVEDAITSTTREQLSLRGAAAVPAATFALASHFRRTHVELVHTNTIKAHVIGGAAARLAGKPSVAHFRDVLDGNAKRVVAGVAAICTRERIAISRAVAASYTLTRTHVVENPVDLEAYASLPPKSEARSVLGLPANAPLIAIVGRINRWKGHDRFVRAAAVVAAETRAHFIIAGSPRFRDADFVPELRTLIEDLGLTERFTFLDWIEDPRILYAAIDIHVNCATREPFGRTTVEAAAAGVPTVCYADSGVAEFVEDGKTALLVVPGDEAALARAILRYAGSDSERTRAGDEARLWSRRFDARRHAERVGAILLEARGSNRRRPRARE